METLRADFYDLSPVKREKLLKEELKLKQIKLRQSLPVLSLQEIRKYRLKHYEALCVELNDSGFPNSAEFIKQLVQHQAELRERFGVGTLVWTRPRLINSKRELKILFKSLGSAENSYNKGEHVVEWEKLLILAIHFAFGSDDWWWLGKQILYQCVSLEYEGHFEKLQAISYYLLGKFLIQNDRNPDGAIYWLDLARELSDGKSWTAKKLLNDEEQDIVFMETCSLLYESLLEKAKMYMKCPNLQKAIEFSILARKRAAESCRHDGEAQAYLLKGQCDLLLNDTTSAIICFTKALKIEIKRNSIIETCEARIQLALAYLQHGKCEEALSNLDELKKFGEEHDLPYYIGQAYRYLGEYYLNGGNPTMATPLLTTAYYKFDQDGNYVCREEARTLAAVSAGEELYPFYVRMIVSSGENEESLMKLSKWKDTRHIIWTENSACNLSLSCKDSKSPESKEHDVEVHEEHEKESQTLENLALEDQVQIQNDGNNTETHTKSKDEQLEKNEAIVGEIMETGDAEPEEKELIEIYKQSETLAKVLRPLESDKEPQGPGTLERPDLKESAQKSIQQEIVEERKE